ncbi:MAG TPA: hypothetical protein PLE43_08360 [Alphaproteobacteria bacterium]|nr:hypothetical protein [Alphaproteobacteria bacterium]
MDNPFLLAYEFEKRYRLDRLKLTLEKAEKAYSSFQPETIDFCKSALECICKTILEESNNPINGIADLPKLIKASLDCVGYSNQQIKGNIAGLVSGFANIRNTQTLAGHGMDESLPLPTKSEIVICVKTFAHITEILLLLLDDDPIDITKTKLKFSKLEEKMNLAEMNEQIDNNVTVEYSQEDGIVYIDGKELRPSEIIYNHDRPAYAQRIDKLKEDALEKFREVIEPIIEEELLERFESFSPGNYGLGDIELYMEDISSITNASNISVSGSVSTSARIGASSSEHSIDVPYSSKFQAKFERSDYDDSSYDLLELTLEVVDWIQVDEPDVA